MERKSLFNKLLNQREDSSDTRLENYFTKILAHLFANSPEILYTWLKDIKLIDNTDNYVRPPKVSPQQHYPALPGQIQDSIIDLEIELYDGMNRDVLFIESKTGLAKGDYDQLQKYAKHLHAKSGVIRQKFLLYVTRIYDEKDENKVLENIPGSAVRFKQKQWSTLQEVLQKQPKNPLLDEIIIFMHENGMGSDDKLTQEMDRVDLSGANLSNAILSGVVLSKTNLSNVNLTNANLNGANLSKANLHGANLTGANLDRADLSEADLSGTDLRDIHNLQKAKLKRANFREANLSGADLQGVDFSRCNLFWADLREADLSYSNLSEANLYSAKLQEANLHEANLYGADLRSANLYGADLSNANMHKINYNGLTIWPEGFNPPADTEMK